MEKKLITKATLDTLLDSNLVFEKKHFITKLNAMLYKHEIELHEKTVSELLKNLQTSSYIMIEDNLIIKDFKTLLHQDNKQRELFTSILQELNGNFDIDYIKGQYFKYIKQQEHTPAFYENLIEDSFNLYLNKLTYNKTNNNDRNFWKIM